MTTTRAARPNVPQVVVVGSANLDITLHVPEIPAAGETALATSSSRGSGGKGANQAVAAARAGARTGLIAAIGSDEAGAQLRAQLAADGIDTSHLRTTPGPSGLALVLLDQDGENLIVVAPNANSTLTTLDPTERALLAEARVVLIQLEIPLSAANDAAASAGDDTLIIVNAAPAQPLPAALRDATDVLVVNEHEAATITGADRAGVDQLLDELLDQVPAAVLTLGAHGSRYASRNGERITVPTPAVEAIDTTGAGDTYCGVLAAHLAFGQPIHEVLAAASTAAALATQRPGALGAIPHATEIAAARTATTAAH